MKVCLSSRQSEIYLKKADEIKVQFRDRKIIPELADKYPNATIILRASLADELDFTELKKYKILTKNKLIMCLADFEDINDLKKLEIPYYWGYPIQTFYELNALKELGVSYLILGAPLFFQLDKVQSFGIPVRAIPNVANNDGVPRDDGVAGTWIRPEDIEAYDQYIDCIEFEHCNQEQEQGLYRTYMEAATWKTDLGALIKDLNHIGNNRLINSDDSRRRITCGQKCQELGACRLCWNMLNLANTELLSKYDGGGK